MNSISSRVTPLVRLLLVNDRISTLEIGRILQKSFVLILNVPLRNLLLDDFITPIIIEPRLSYGLLGSSRFQKSVGGSGDVKVDPKQRVRSRTKVVAKRRT